MKTQLTAVVHSVLVCLFLFFSHLSFGQQGKVVRYYDAYYQQVPKDSSFYFAEFVKTDTLYNVKMYWTKSMRLKSQTVYTDTTFNWPIGLRVSYHENGSLQDSAMFIMPSVPGYWRRYYPNGDLHVHYEFNPKTEQTVTRAWDKDGKQIKGYVFYREASFPGGVAAFSTYVGYMSKTKIKIKKKTPPGDYKVLVKFVVDVDGKLVDVEPMSNFGYNLEEQVIKIVQNSPDWIPAVQEGRPVKAYRILPVTVQVG